MKFGILVLSLMLVTGQAAQDDVKREVEKLQGNWAITSFNGEAVPPEAEFYLALKGDKYEQWMSGSVNERGSIKIDPRTKPMSIDLVITEGDDAGKTQPGVYELNGETISLGLAIPGNTVRPTAVSQAELQVVLKKVK
jgi:uncharacterized protein (TIGR03067 family)